MTSSSGAALEVELQGSSWDGAFLVTRTTRASNHAPMFVSRASTYSLTCEDNKKTHPTWKDPTSKPAAACGGSQALAALGLGCRPTCL